MTKKTNVMGEKTREIENRIDNIESVIKNRLSLDKEKFMREIRTLEKIQDDMTELQQWKDRAFERINNQDTRLDDRLRELKNLEERIEKTIIPLSNKVDKTMKDQGSYFEEEISKIKSILKKFKEFESRTTTFMNEIVEEYEKRFEILRGEIKMTPYAFPTIKEKKTSKFLNKIKKIILGKKVRVEELEKKVKEQHNLIKKMMDELEDLTESNSKSGDENA